MQRVGETKCLLAVVRQRMKEWLGYAMQCEHCMRAVIECRGQREGRVREWWI